MMTLSEVLEHVGGKVVYRAPHVADDQPGEEGVITGASSIYAFVRFGADVGSMATPAENLTLVAPPVEEPEPES
ncbi:hypothetical protein SEA_PHRAPPUCCINO_100 [Mycobacterium phage Phrappuccino]|uniref:Uncharacterized protein n=1 Tax=Mycobacterium phage Phrappuccino TaxID=2591223 RepID=A0A514DDT7_9CAUD|nr:hypothetical protein KHQ87_gp100 [Mycobacterium phage Phrappuccino]QDH91775.1 hypothetical protein SEA_PHRAPPUCCINO_100 [Mycobacterium phage Phrappuccino]QIQ63217.1 hypothetical protein SEA_SETTECANDELA_100 [Mycobacterium phage Settecandela]